MPLAPAQEVVVVDDGEQLLKPIMAPETYTPFGSLTTTRNPAVPVGSVFVGGGVVVDPALLEPVVTRTELEIGEGSPVEFIALITT